MNMTNFDQLDQFLKIGWSEVYGSVKYEIPWRYINPNIEIVLSASLVGSAYLGKTSKINYLFRFIRKTWSSEKEFNWYNIYPR